MEHGTIYVTRPLKRENLYIPYYNKHKLISLFIDLIVILVILFFHVPIPSIIS